MTSSSHFSEKKTFSYPWNLEKQFHGKKKNLKFSSFQTRRRKILLPHGGRGNLGSPHPTHLSQSESKLISVAACLLPTSLLCLLNFFLWEKSANEQFSTEYFEWEFFPLLLGCSVIFYFISSSSVTLFIPACLPDEDSMMVMSSEKRLDFFSVFAVGSSCWVDGLRVTHDWTWSQFCANIQSFT